MNNDNEERLNLATYKLYNDYKEFINNCNENNNNNNTNAFMKLTEVKNDGDKYSESEKEIILSKFVALVFENKK